MLATLPEIFDDPVAQQFDRDVVIYLDNASQPICFISDMLLVKAHPSLKTILNWRHLKHEQMGFAASVGLTVNPAARFISGIIMRSASLIGIQAGMNDFATVDDVLAHISGLKKKH